MAPLPIDLLQLPLQKQAFVKETRVYTQQEASFQPMVPPQLHRIATTSSSIPGGQIYLVDPRMEKVWEQFDQALKQPKQGEQENVILGGETASQQ